MMEVSNYKCRSCGTEFTEGDGNRSTAENHGWVFDQNKTEPLCNTCKCEDDHDWMDDQDGEVFCKDCGTDHPGRINPDNTESLQDHRPDLFYPNGERFPSGGPMHRSQYPRNPGW